MRFISILSALVVLCVLGCKPNKETLLPGTWKSAHGTIVTFKSDNTYSSASSVVALTETGTWKIDDGDCVLTPVALDGKAIPELKQRALARRGSKPMSAKMQQVFDDIGKPNFFTIGEDGKTMKTDKARDTNSGDPWNLTKQ